MAGPELASSRSTHEAGSVGLTLITGASGFVGSHLMREMRQRGLPARGVSRQDRPGLVAIPSYSATTNWHAYLSEVDVIVHLAARVHVMRETAADPLSAFREANVEATLSLARQAAKAGVKRFVFVSTIKVNGEQTEATKPFTSEDPINPQDPYAISKAEAETILLALGQDTGMEIVILRPALIYGPGVGGNFRRLMNWAASGYPSIFAGVKNIRSLLYVGNLCDLIITTLTHPDAANRVFLACDDQAFSTHQLLLNLAAASGQDIRSIRIPPPVLRTLGRLAFQEDAMGRLLNNLEIDATATGKHLSWRCPFDSFTGLSTSMRRDSAG